MKDDPCIPSQARAHVVVAKRVIAARGDIKSSAAPTIITIRHLVKK
jgi:hypothetical protein